MAIPPKWVAVPIWLKRAIEAAQGRPEAAKNLICGFLFETNRLTVS